MTKRHPRQGSDRAKPNRAVPGTAAHAAMTLMLYTGAARTDAGGVTYATIGLSTAGVRRPSSRRSASTFQLIRNWPSSWKLCRATHSPSKKTTAGNPVFRPVSESCSETPAAWRGLAIAVHIDCARPAPGATPHGIAAVTGHTTLSEVERYTRAAERAGMADQAFAKMKTGSNREQKLTNHSKRFAKKDEK